MWTSHVFNPGYGSPMTRVVIADLDKDGRNDIVVSPSDTSLALRISWHRAVDPKAGPWTGRTIMPAGRAAYIHSLQAVDMDGDGHADVLTGSDHRGSREMLVYYNDDRSRGRAWKEHAFRSGCGKFFDALGRWHLGLESRFPEMVF